MKQLILRLGRLTLKSSLSAVLLLVFSHAFATTYTFNGTTNTDWNTASNWSPSGPPSPLTSGNEIVIAANCVANPWNQIISSGATFTVNSGVTMDAINGQFHLNGTLTINGTFKWAHETFNLNSGSMTTIVAGGTLEQYGGNSFQVFASGATLTNHGTFTKNQGGAAMSGTWTNQSGSSFNILSGQTLNIGSSDMSFNTGSTVTNNGTFQSNIARAINGLYKGSGTTSFALTNNGTVAPGASPGCLTFSAGYTNSSGSTLEIEIVNATACSGHDKLNVTGTATLSGTLALNISYTPSTNTTLTIIDASSLSGTFSSVTGLASGWSLSYISGTGNVELSYSLLPVELVGFAGKSVENAIRLDWLTASESNNQGFGIERSGDGIHWQELGFVAGAGTTTQAHDYSFLDEKPLLGVNYYRLRQVDFDGGEEFSKMVHVLLDAETKPRIFPTLTDGIITIENDGESVEQISVFSANGQLVITARQAAQLDLSALQPGLYLVQLRSTIGIVTERIAKR